MALEQRARSQLLAQLLAGDEPRCFWTPPHVFTNEAFDRADVDREAILSRAQRAFSNEEDAKALQLGPFRFVFTRIVHNDVRGVLVMGIPVSGYYDARLAALPEILQFNSGRMPNAVNLHRLMELVMRTDRDLFSDALLFASERGEPFLLLHDLGVSRQAPRLWVRWPLERLFNKRRAAVITNPVTGEKGLAIPFQVAPAERYVIIFTLRTAELDKADRDLLSVLECIAAVVPQTTSEWRSNVRNRIDAPAVPCAPRLFYYGNPKLRARIEHLISRHGWELDSAVNHTETIASLASESQMILIDGSAMPPGPRMLRALRNAAASAPILYFAENCDEETQILVDARVSPTASDDQIFAALKSIVRELPQRRRDYLEALVGRLTPVLLSATSFRQLASVIAQCLVPHFADWAAVHLFDSTGELYRAEFPDSDEPIMQQVPMTFINGYAVMKSRVDQEFFAELCDEPLVWEALAALQARSGAAIPLLHSGTLVGSIVALSTERDLDEADFEGLASFAEAASDAFASLQTRALRIGTFDAAWTRISVGLYHVDIYRPQRARDISVRVSPLEGCRLRFELIKADQGRLSATLDAKRHRLAYETVHFPVPFHVPAKGPVTLAQRDVPESSTGVIVLEEPSLTLVHDAALTRAIDPATIVKLFRRALQEGQSNPASLLADVDADRFPFVAISLR